MLELLNQYGLASKLDFESFVEAKHKIKILSDRPLGQQSPPFDDDKTHGIIYTWIKDKLHKSSSLTHANIQ